MRRRRRNAFTLVELLVACGVLTVLMALTLQVHLMWLQSLAGQRQRLWRQRDARVAVERLKRDVRSAAGVEVTDSGRGLWLRSPAGLIRWLIDESSHRLYRAAAGAGLAVRPPHAAKASASGAEDAEAAFIEWPVEGRFRVRSSPQQTPLVSITLRFAPATKRGAPLVVQTFVSPRRPKGGRAP